MKEWLLEKKWRTILAGILIATVPLIMLSGYIYQNVASILENRLIKENQRLVQFMAHTIEEGLRTEVAYAKAFTTRPLFQEGVAQHDVKEIHRHLAGLIENSNVIEQVFVTDASGIMLDNYPYRPESLGRDFSARDWYKGVSKNWTPYVSEFYMRTTVPQRYLFAIAVPIQYRGKVVGILVTQPNADFLRNIITEASSQNDKGSVIPLSLTYIVDKKGQLVYHTDIVLDRIEDYSNIPVVRNVTKGLAGVERFDDPVNNLPMLAAYYPIKNWGWGVVMEAPIHEILAPINQMKWALFASTILVVLIGAYLALQWSQVMLSLKNLSNELETKVQERTAELLKINRVLKTLSECNKALVKADDEKMLTENICRIITEHGGYRMTLVGFPEHDENKTVQLVAQSGYEDDFLEKVRMTWADTASSQGLIGRSIREGGITIFRNIAADERYPALWREAAGKRGYASAIGLPLMEEKGVLGALAIYSSDSDAFDDAEVELFKELANDLAYGITSIRVRAAHGQAVESLRGSEEQLRHLMDGVKDYAIIMLDTKGRIASWNQGAERLMGYRSEEIIGRHMSCFNPEEAEKRGWTEHELLMTKRDGRFEDEGWRKRKDDSLFWANVIITAVCDEQGGLRSFTMVTRDITDRKRAEDAMEKAAMEWRTAMDASTDIICLLDINRRVIRANKAFYELTRSSPATAIGRPTAELIHPQDTQEHCIICQAQREMRDFSLIMEEEHPDNPLGRPIEANLRVIRDKEGQPISMLMSYHDLTAERESQEEKAKAEAQYQTILRTTIDGFAIVDRNGCFIEVNDAYCTMTGYSREEFLTMNVTNVEAVESPKEIGQKIAQIIEKGHARFESKHRRKDGGTIDLDISINYSPEMGGQFFSFLRDITEHKKLEEQLLQSQKMESIGQLAGGVAHDFNNILSAIIGYGHLTLMKMREDDSLRAHINQILEASQRATTLTQNLLAFSRKQSMDLAVLDLNSLVQHFGSFLKRLLREDIDLKIICQEGELNIAADRGQIENVIMNLVTNANDAMPDGGTLTIETRPATIQNDFLESHGYGLPGEYALLMVSDTGMGMDEKTRQKIFEPFFTTKEVGKGTGLGLAMVYGTVKKHEGLINIYSEVGEGTTVKIYFPLVKATTAEGEIKDAAVTPVRGGTETVLMAEDDKALRNMTSIILRHFGYTVIEAVDGQDAVFKYVENKDKINLVILDGIMPKKNGWQAYEEIHLMTPAVKVIFMSGYSEDIFSVKNISEKGLTYIEKPITPSEMVKKIREVLDK